MNNRFLAQQGRASVDEFVYYSLPIKSTGEIKRKHQYLIGYSSSKRALENNKSKHELLEPLKKTVITAVKPKVLSLEIPQILNKSSIISNSEARMPQPPLLKKATNLINSPKASGIITRKFNSVEYKALAVSSPSMLKQKNELDE